MIVGADEVVVGQPTVHNWPTVPVRTPGLAAWVAAGQNYRHFVAQGPSGKWHVYQAFGESNTIVKIDKCGFLDRDSAKVAQKAIGKVTQ